MSKTAKVRVMCSACRKFMMMRDQAELSETEAATVQRSSRGDWMLAPGVCGACMKALTSEDAMVVEGVTARVAVMCPRCKQRKDTLDIPFVTVVDENSFSLGKRGWWTWSQSVCQTCVDKQGRSGETPSLTFHPFADLAKLVKVRRAK